MLRFVEIDFDDVRLTVVSMLDCFIDAYGRFVRNNIISRAGHNVNWYLKTLNRKIVQSQVSTSSASRCSSSWLF